MNRIIVETECDVCADVLELTCLDGHPKRLMAEFSPEAIEAAAERLEDLDLKVMTRRGIVTEVLAAALQAERNR